MLDLPGVVAVAFDAQLLDPCPGVGDLGVELVGFGSGDALPGPAGFSFAFGAALGFGPPVPPVASAHVAVRCELLGVAALTGELLQRSGGVAGGRVDPFAATRLEREASPVQPVELALSGGGKGEAGIGRHRSLHRVALGDQAGPEQRGAHRLGCSGVLLGVDGGGGRRAGVDGPELAALGAPITGQVLMAVGTSSATT